MTTSSVFDSPVLPLLIELEQQGFVLRLTEAGKLHVEPGSRLTDAQRHLLAAHKSAAVLLLRCCDPGVVSRRDAFRVQLEAAGSAMLPALVFIPGVPYTAGVCFSCGDGTDRAAHGRCWRCSLAWRLACRVPLTSEWSAVIDSAKRVA